MLQTMISAHMDEDNELFRTLTNKRDECVKVLSDTTIALDTFEPRHVFLLTDGIYEPFLQELKIIGISKKIIDHGPWYRKDLKQQVFFLLREVDEYWTRMMEYRQGRGNSLFYKCVGYTSELLIDKVDRAGEWGTFHTLNKDLVDRICSSINNGAPKKPSDCRVYFQSSADFNY